MDRAEQQSNTSRHHASLTESGAELSALRRHQRRLLYGGGGLLSLLIVLTAIGIGLFSIQGFHARQLDIFQDGRAIIDAFLGQREHGYMGSLRANNALWSTQQNRLQIAGEPIEKQFMAQGERLFIQADDSSVPWLALGHGTASMPATKLAAYLGMIREYSAYTSSTISAMESPGQLTVYAYEPSGSFFAIAGVRDETQLFAVLKVTTREQAFARMTLPETQWQPAVIGTNAVAPSNNESIAFHFARNPVTGEPALMGAMTLSVDRKVYFRRVVFESLALLKDRLQPTSPAAFLVVTRAGQLVLDSGQLPVTPEQSLAQLRQAGLWTSWPSAQATYRARGTFLIADQVKGVDWAIVHLYTWRQMLANLWKLWALIAAVTVLILGALWALLLRMDRRVFAPALAGASLVYESEELNRVIIDTSPVGLCLLNPKDASAILQNDVMRRFADDCVERSPSLYQRLIEQAGDNLSGPTEFKWVVERLDGNHRNLLVAAAPANYRVHRVLLCAVRDVTAQAELEDKLRQARHDSELAKQAAEAASRAKSAFVAIMSHEIRTPLNGILGHLELLSRSQLDAPQRGRLDRIRLSADSLLAIVSDVLDFSKVEAGQLDIDPMPFQLRPLIEHAVLLFAPLAQRKGLSLYFSIDSVLAPSYISDVQRIRQIINNLVSNAVKFTESGRVVLRASLGASVHNEHGLLRFEVIDSGIGMSEAQLAQLFEPFSQADASISRRFGGSGLGLALCRQLSQLLGGHIDVQSTPGVGSIFTLEVPADRDSAPQPDNSTMFAGKRIALLAGSVECREEISVLLTSWGVELTAAGNPAGLDVEWVRHASALLVFGMQSSWSDEDEQALITCARRVIRAQADGPLVPEQRDGALCISCYSSTALQAAIRQEDAMSQPVVSISRPPDGQSSQGKGRVLLVDDNPVNRELIQQQLETLGYTVDTADDGERALQVWGNDTFDAVLTDINMPRMNGYELTRALRELGVTLPILAVTATALASEKLRCKEAGITDLLLKPLSLEQLNAAMSRHVAVVESVPAETPVSQERRKFPEKVLRAFVESGTHDVDTMMAAWHRQDEVTLLERLHSLKGALFMLGEHPLAKECASLEKRTEEEGLGAMGDALARFERELRDVLDRYAGEL
ncbi:MAG: response regulator [Rhodanobacter sp.]